MASPSIGHAEHPRHIRSDNMSMELGDIEPAFLMAKEEMDQQRMILDAYEERIIKMERDMGRLMMKIEAIERKIGM